MDATDLLATQVRDYGWVATVLQDTGDSKVRTRFTRQILVDWSDGLVLETVHTVINSDGDAEYGSYEFNGQHAIAHAPRPVRLRYIRDQWMTVNKRLAY